MVKKLFFLLLLINLFSLLKVNAAQYNPDAFSAQLYDNRSGSLVASSTSNTGAAYYGVLNLTGYGSGGAWGISSPTIILANHTYVLTANISLGSSNLALSSINRIGLGATLDNARVSYQNNTNAEELYSRVVGTDLVQFAFKSSINGSFIVFPFTSTNTTQTDIFLSYVNFEDLGEGGLSQTDITNSLNSQTNNINSNSDRNRDAIIDNQNENTQAIIDSNKENFQTCFNNYFNVMNVGYTSTSTGTAERTGQQVKVITTTSNRNDVITTKKLSDVAPDLVVGQSYRLSFKMDNVRNRIYLVGSNYVWVNNTDRVITQDDLDSYITFYTNTYPGTGYYSEIMIQKSDNISSSYIPYGEKCTNKLDEQTNAINGLNDSITSEDSPNTNEDINDMQDMVASDAPISDLITMPLTLIHAYINGVNSSCSPINLGNLYGTDLVLPCINLEQRLGSNLWRTIDALFSIYMCYNIGMLFITAFDGITSLRDDFEGLYQPRHADTGYKPKHGGGN